MRKRARAGGRPAIRIALALSSALALCGGALAAPKAWDRHIISAAALLLREGHPVLAENRILGSRERLTRSIEGCDLLCDVFGATRDIDMLGWAAETCMDRGFRSESIWLALAHHRRWTGQSQEELAILTEAQRMIHSSPMLLAEAARTHRDLEDPHAACVEYSAASSLAKESLDLAKEGLEYCLPNGRGLESLNIAIAARGQPTEDPRLRLLLARALLGGRNKAAEFRQEISEAKELMTRLPQEDREALAREFARELAPIAGQEPQTGDRRKPSAAAPAHQN